MTIPTETYENPRNNTRNDSPPLPLDILPSGRQPLYRQIARRLADTITDRELRPGDPLLPAGELASQLVVSPQAVRRAYEELTLEGLLENDGHGGLRVTPEAAVWEREQNRRATLRTLVEEELSLEEVRLAREVQKRLLPPPRIAGDGFEIVARSFPARFVAGDFYDVLRHADGSVGVVVGDVAGKGIGPSLIMASVKAVLPFLAEGRDVAGTLAALNARLSEELDRREMVALAYARFEPATRRLTLANAGLPDAWRLAPGKEPEELEVPGPRLPLGVRRELDYEVLETRLEPGERFLLATDGLAEARTTEGEPLGYARFAEILGEIHAGTNGDGPGANEDLLDDLLRKIRRTTGRRHRAPAIDDDTTALLIESRG